MLNKVENNSNLFLNAFGTDVDLNFKASPIYNITSGVSYPKFFVAKRGNSERIAVADNFIEVLKENGVSVSQVDGSIYDHSGINNAIGEPNEILITDGVKSFLKECFE